MMNILINNARYSFTAPAHLSDVPQKLAIAPDAIALARNHQIVFRKDWADTLLEDGDEIDAFTVVAGG